MPIVKMFFQETMLRYNMCFLQGNTLIGTHWEFADAAQVIQLMEAANCRFRDIQSVRKTLKERRHCSHSGTTKTCQRAQKGMMLAQAFLISCGEGENRLGTEEPSDRIADLTACYMALVEHGEGCDDCNEV
jgi:hypothetical protein